MRPKIRWIGVVVLLNLAVGGLLVPWYGEFHDGAVLLQVAVRSHQASKIRRISVQAFRAPALDIKSTSEVRLESSEAKAMQDPFLGQSLEVSVLTSHYTQHAVLYSTTSNYFQYDKLMVVVHDENDQWQAKIVELPDLRVKRFITVEMP